MNSKKIIKFFIPNQNIYLWIIGILVLILFRYNIIISLIGGVIFVYLVYYKATTTYKSEERWKEIVENLTLDIDAATQNILLDLPFPLLIIKKDGEVIWYNSYFREACKVETNILSMKITDLLTDIDLNDINKIIGNKNSINYSLGEKIFKVFSNAVESINSEDILMLYWLDITDYELIKQNYISEKPLIAYIQIDNYDEVLQDSSESYRPLINAVIDRKINAWAKELDAFIKKYETDKYIMVFEQKYLSPLEEKRFNILDIIRETQSGNKIPVTLSIGVGNSQNSLSFMDSQRLSKSALDIALARGGDQCVVKKDEKISYYGGKSQAIEKRTKVKARVKAHGIKELIQNSDKVYILGHQIPDVDCLGAALGIYRCSKFLDKETNIIFNKSNPSVDILYETLIKNNYSDVFISSEIASKNITSNTLVIAVDVHRRSFVEDSNILDKAEKIIIIDHHRRGSDFIDDAVMVYLEPYASSTCELVSEIIEYMDEGIKLEEVEATALLAGIYMDTKNFSFRTGVRTFEAASFLKRKGADINKCKQLLKDDKDIFVAKIEAVKDAEITEENMAIASIDYTSDKIKLIVAQTADELLNLQGVNASFVIAQDDGVAIISGRSLGDVNVQVILEKLGGGGHLSVAGAQLENVSNEEAKIMLKQEIKDYIREGEDK
ncbi:DHH family phosphoesterase [Alkalibaculum sporogenes]|uniref:DHH family phosphoesterase n=1 Tax=Alkalibaculum sporogenes TaxID=2655001 RepID=UPI00187B8853